LTKLGKLIDAFLELIYPSLCAGCKGVSTEPICKDCLAKIEMINEPICRYCGRSTEYDVEECRDCRGKKLHFDGARALFEFEGTGKDIIHSFKYDRETRLAPMIAERIVERRWFTDLDMVTFVPLFGRKKIERGYDQAELIAKEISRLSGIRHVRLLKRDRYTKDQNKLDHIARRKNVSGAFSSTDIHPVLEKSILLVDDVYTTGRTISECAKILKAEGAKSVYGAVAAKAIIR